MKATIFTLWEPRDAVVPYIGLCMKTWRTAFAGREVVVLDHSNLADHVGDAASDMETARLLPLSIQKDAIMVAVLREQGGVFIDADTVAVGDVTPLLDALDGAEVATFGLHLAATAARPQGRLLNAWYAGIQKKLAMLASGTVTPAQVPWDFVGNSVLLSTMDDIIDSQERKPFPIALADRGVDWLKRYASARSSPLLTRLRHSIVYRRRALYFRTVYRSYLTTLDREDHGFMPELLYYRREPLTPREKYVRYWFESDAGLDTALLPNQTLIGLHHSWTPEWYKQLSEAEVLAHPCLLSRTLRYLLGR